MTHLTNRDARKLWLHQNGLLAAPTRAPDVMAIIRDLGFLQIDTIRNVVRAQDHILWSRSQTYREGAVWRHLASRHLFEHFTHDASLIPRETLPHWQRRFRDLGRRTANADWYRSGLGQHEIEAIRDRIEREGALSTHAFDTKAASREMWARPPHKKALDQMWYAGTLATCHRDNFVKYYDLGSRVLGEVNHDADPAPQARALHAAAMRHLGIATPSEIYKFWAATSPAEVKDWIASADLVPVTLDTAQGTTHRALATPEALAALPDLPDPVGRLRIVNPFDPAFRDRTRTERLFGFYYRNEMFVPQAQRVHGYYVYPLLDGLDFVGRTRRALGQGADRPSRLRACPLRAVGWPWPCYMDLLPPLIALSLAQTRSGNGRGMIGRKP